MTGDIQSRTCFQSELHFAKSLENVTAELPSSYVPAAILFDETGPFAYQKAVGRHAAFAWRDSWLETRTGRRLIPGGYLFELRYGNLPLKGERRWYPHDPRLAMVGSAANTGLVHYAPHMPDGVVLGRLSTQYIPRRHRLLVHEVAANELWRDHEVDLRQYVQDGSALTNRQLSKKVAALLVMGKAVDLAAHL